MYADPARLPRPRPTPSHHPPLSQIASAPARVPPLPLLRALQLSTPLGRSNNVHLGNGPRRLLDQQLQKGGAVRTAMAGEESEGDARVWTHGDGRLDESEGGEEEVLPIVLDSSVSGLALEECRLYAGVVGDRADQGSVMLFTGFFAAVAYHTSYSLPWIYPCAALYAYEWVLLLGPANQVSVLTINL
jgi:hypothetical protein